MNCNRNMNMPMHFRQNIFSVDLGVDLRTLQPEIAECKRRFQQDLWNTIFNKVLQDGSGWKKKIDGDKRGSFSKETKTAAKSEEKGEEEGAAADNTNNARTKKQMADKDRQPPGGRTHLARQSRPIEPAPVSVKQNPITVGRRVNSAHSGGGRARAPKPLLQSRPGARVGQPAGSNNDNSLLRHPQPPRSPPQRRPAASNAERGKTEEPSRCSKKLSKNREPQHASAALVGGADNRAGINPACKTQTSVQKQQQQQQQRRQFTHPRSYSANSEIPRAYSLEPQPEVTFDADEFLEATDTADLDARTLFLKDRDSGCRLTLNGGYSQLFSGSHDPEFDSNSYQTSVQDKNVDAASKQTREFVPLVVGDWLALSRRIPPRQIL